MDLRLLQYFLAVVDEGSVNAAAAKVHVAQPSLSRQIRRLETDLAFADTPQQRLLAVLAKTLQQSKSEEYRLAGLRHTLARRQLAQMAREHARLAAAYTEAIWTDHQAANAAKRP